MKVSDVVEAFLAILVVGGIVAIAAYDAIAGKPVNVPPELYGFGGIIIGAYFRGRSVNGTIAGLTTALQQSAPASPEFAAAWAQVVAAKTPSQSGPPA